MERRGYEGVIATITSECERLQASLSAAEAAVDDARAKAARWKERCVRVCVHVWCGRCHSLSLFSWGARRAYGLILF